MDSKEKQIEEMAYEMTQYKETVCKRIEHNNCLLRNHAHAFIDCHFCKLAEHLITEKGYRKASDVAREIFEEIEKEIELALESNYRAKKEHYNHSVIPNYDNFNAMCDGKIYAMRGLLDFIAELKKKYTEGEG